MVKARQEKVDRIADYIPEQVLDSGPEKATTGTRLGSLMVPSNRRRELQREGLEVSHAHLRYIQPSKNLERSSANFEQVLIPELNNGQLIRIIQTNILLMPLDTTRSWVSFTKTELVRKMKETLNTECEGEVWKCGSEFDSTLPHFTFPHSPLYFSDLCAVLCSPV
jgi:2-oxoglutarate ferredoxin oxidoreductase subunit alpha